MKIKKLAMLSLQNNQKNIDVILGAHTHTFLDTPVSYKNSDGKEVLIAQVGWAGIRLGRIDYIFERKGKKKAVEGYSIKISNKSTLI